MPGIAKSQAHKHQLRIWAVFECGIPILFFGLSWPIAAIYGDLPASFFRVFSTGDLVIFAALLCIGMYKDIEVGLHNQDFPPDSFYWSKASAIGIAIVFLYLYGFMKSASMSFSFEFESPSDVALLTNVYGSLSFVIFACVFCFSVRWRIIGELARLEQ